ncbi:hypothetical protein M9Y10_017227 [Tritrichomonas musculus]|uniref:Glycosyl transferase CAP10 domain-containing protein n=1 Tax=Tritrichomonas musculus TaxID=1915356 RepID=A0ABR2HXC6_9EUKA
MPKINNNVLFLIIFTSYSYIFFLFFKLHLKPNNFVNLKPINDDSNDATTGKLFKISKIRNASNIKKKFEHYTVKELTKCKSSNWAVTTSINYPTRALLQISMFKEICLVIVGDKKSPSNFSINSARAIYLPVSVQKQLPYKIIEILPLNNFARKIIGYLYAIQHGASQIYDFDDDNILINNNVNEIFEHKKMRLIISNDLVFNAYRFFQKEKETYIWPRGYPLELIKNKQEFDIQDKKNINNHVQVIQFLQNENPDLDAIYRLTQKIPSTFRKDYNQCIAINNYCPFNSQSTLFSYDSFPLLLLPMTVNGRVSDIWRSYILEKILSVNGNFVSFCPSIVEHLRNPHSLLKDFNAELPLYTQSNELIQFLKKLQIDKSFDLALEQIYIALYENNILQIDDLELVSRWLFDLKTIGFNF